MNKVHWVKTKKYGDTMVTNNSKEQKVYDDTGHTRHIFPVGIVVRWIDDNKGPQIDWIAGLLTTDFKSEKELADYIDSNI